MLWVLFKSVPIGEDMATLFKRANRVNIWLCSKSVTIYKYEKIQLRLENVPIDEDMGTLLKRANFQVMATFIKRAC